MRSSITPAVTSPYSEVARAQILCEQAKGLIEFARDTRAVIHVQRGRPLRRVLQLARGGSDQQLEPETEERRCPYCGGKTVSPVGSVVAANNKLRIGYRCDGCDKRFVFIRTPVDFTSAETGASRPGR